jgi:hypothetical protein
MRSAKHIQASKTNGALSRGPITRQGKRNSARNSTRHGLLAQTVVLEEESTERFQELLAGYMEDYDPRSSSEVSLVETMAVARWRQLRVWGAQKSVMDRDMALQDPNVGPASVRVIAALRGSPESSCQPEVLLRYEIAFDRQFSRALTRLLALQARPTTRQPEPYHPATPAGQTWKEEPRKEEEEKAPLPNEPNKELKNK